MYDARDVKCYDKEHVTNNDLVAYAWLLASLNVRLRRHYVHLMWAPMTIYVQFTLRLCI